MLQTETGIRVHYVPPPASGSDLLSEHSNLVSKKYLALHQFFQYSHGPFLSRIKPRQWMEAAPRRQTGLPPERTLHG
jgi:hypothetical protein